MRPLRLRLAFALLIVHLACARAAEPLADVMVHPGGVAYYTCPMFADAVAQGSEWMTTTLINWSDSVAHPWNNPDFNAAGLPIRMPSTGQWHAWRLVPYGLHTGAERSGITAGLVTLSWRGRADVRLYPTEGFVAELSSGAATGVLADGVRCYRLPAGLNHWIDIHAMEGPLEELHLWLPDPADRQNRSLVGQRWHPDFLRRLTEQPWRVMRTMDMTVTNGSPVKDWEDRRPPGLALQAGVLNPRVPTDGIDIGYSAGANRSTGVAYELLVDLCNRTGLDLWINIPHLATDDFVARLARLLRHGSDGREPYPVPVRNPVWAPLDPQRRVFIEYSNEIWAGGNGFVQGDWAAAMATAAGISKAQWNARRFCEVWGGFQEVFGGTERLVRVAALFTGQEYYSRAFASEIARFGPTLDPPVTADVLAPSTYFGNAIEAWSHGTALAAAGTSAPWFYTAGTFDGGRPVSVPLSDSYWSSDACQAQQNRACEEWSRRQLGELATAGGSQDATSFSGGFAPWVADLARTLFPTRLPIVAYEGGPSIYTTSYDGGDIRDDGLTDFITRLNRHPLMARIYRTNLEFARAAGLRSHSAFTLCDAPGKYGQWGHLEQLDADDAASPKWLALRDWMSAVRGMRRPDDPLGAVPAFATAQQLPGGRVGETYSADIATAGGDGARTLRVVASTTIPGLALAMRDGDGLHLAGTPRAGGTMHLLARVMDADGDPAWRIFSATVRGEPGVLLDCDFRGDHPSEHLPWTQAYDLAGAAFSGWTAGSGLRLTSTPGNAADWPARDVLAWSQSGPGERDPSGNPISSTLDEAITQGQWWSATITPAAALDLRRATIRFTMRRLWYHSPRRFALFLGPAGFAAGQAVQVSSATALNQDVEQVVQVPDDPVFAALGGPVEIRIVPFAANYANHTCAFAGFSIRLPPASAPPSLAVERSLVAVRAGDTATLALTATDADTPAADLVASVASDDPWLLPPGSLSLTGNPPSALSMAPPPGRSGVCMVALGLGDGSTTIRRLIAVQVEAGAEAPQITAIAIPARIATTAVEVDAVAVDDGGTAALTYAWSGNGPAPVAFSGTGHAATATFAHAGTYTLAVAVRDGEGNETIRRGTITVEAQPAGVRVEPATATLAPGQTLGLEAGLFDQFGLPLHADGFTWTAAGGAISADGVFTAGATTGIYRIAAVAAGQEGATSIAILGDVPLITVQPSSVAVPSGGRANLLVSAIGSGLDYQWYRGSSGDTSQPVDGANGASYATPPLTEVVGYWVRVSGTGGHADSDTAVVAIIAPPPGGGGATTDGGGGGCGASAGVLLSLFALPLLGWRRRGRRQSPPARC